MKLFAQRKKEPRAPYSLLIDGKTITNKQNKSEDFNNCFASVDKDFQERIHTTTKEILLLLEKKNSNTFWINPTTQKEVPGIIQELKSNKATGPHSLPASVIKSVKQIISLSLSTLISEFDIRKNIGSGKFLQVKQAMSLPEAEIFSNFCYGSLIPVHFLT